MASGIRDSLVTFASRVASVLLSFASQSCLAWFLGPAGRGSYAVCLVFANVLSMICMIGLDNGCHYFVASKKATISQGVVHLGFLGAMGSALAMAAGVFALMLPLAYFQKADADSFRLALLFIPLNFFGTHLPMLLTSIRDFTWYAIIFTLRVVAQLGGIVLFTGIMGWGVNGVLLAFIAAAALAAVLALAVMRIKHGLKAALPSLGLVRGVLSYGCRYYFGKLSNLVNVQIGTILLAMLAGKADVGLFAIAMTLTIQVLMVPDTLGTVLLPRVASDPAGRPHLVARSARLSGLICGLILLVGCLLARPLVPVFFSPRFVPSIVLIWIMAPGVWLRSATKIFLPFFNGINRPGISSVAVIGGVTTNFVLMLLLLPVMGLPGGALAVTCGYVVSSLILAFSFWRVSRMSPLSTWRLTREDLAVLGNVLRSVRGRLSGQARPVV